MRRTLLATVGLTILAIFSLCLPACGQQPASNQSTTSPTTPTTPVNMPSAGNIAASPSVSQLALPSIVDVVAKARPSVVSIDVDVTTYNRFNQPVQQQGAGSGWIMRSDGYIVTNNHVVEGATNITVTLDDGRTFPADKTFTDPVTDLAVVKINAQNLTALDIGDSSKLQVGEWVVAIGNALAEGISATQGIVSALGISISASPGQTLQDLIQTDAAINPGNSGGPMVNMAGEVVGITSLKVSQVGVEGMGYAMSINQAIPVLNTLVSTGSVIRASLGVSVYTVDSQVAAFYNLGVNKGVLITDVAAGSPGDKAGLRAGDIITAIDGKEQLEDSAMMDLINSLKIGQTIKVTYYRGNALNTVSATLVASPKS
jgi:serine protease Do